MTLSALGLFAGAIFLVAISPGPTAVALVARVITHGGWSVLPFTVALWIGEALWLTVTILGLSVFLEQFGWAFIVIKWLGVLFLILLAYSMWFSPRPSGETPLPEETSAFRLFFAGLTVTFTNPKVIAFYLALLPAVMDFGHISFGDWLELTLTLVCVLAAVDIGTIILAETARRRIRTLNNSLLVNKCSAVAMGSAAVMIASR